MRTTTGTGISRMTPSSRGMPRGGNAAHRRGHRDYRLPPRGSCVAPERATVSQVRGLQHYRRHFADVHAVSAMPTTSIFASSATVASNSSRAGSAGRTSHRRNGIPPANRPSPRRKRAAAPAARFREKYLRGDGTRIPVLVGFTLSQGRDHRVHPGHHISDKGRSGIREADQRKDEFLAMLAHELRNPLSASAAPRRLSATRGRTPGREMGLDVAERQLRYPCATYR